MKDQSNNSATPKPTTPIEMLTSEDYLDETQDTELRRASSESSRIFKLFGGRLVMVSHALYHNTWETDSGCSLIPMPASALT